MEFSSLYVSVSGEFYKDLVTTDAFSFSDPGWIQRIVMVAFLVRSMWCWIIRSAWEGCSVLVPDQTGLRAWRTKNLKLETQA
ncbi:hypothetical protein V7x_06690 [Crateriforma conspicua]|uniref:Uncharacterized protein n=2 Tax=Planctomycetaceae TaxID=126 RepID=A0A5C6FVR6_9PLAN|nr:hypothetical protein V7x_06690 [Crateriforma conspicua]